MITSQIAPRTIEEYEFFYSNIAFTATIDTAAGDTIAFLDDCIFIKLAGRPSLADPEQSTGDEEQTLFREGLVKITKRVREVVPIQPEQRDEIRDFIKRKVTKTVH